MMFWRLALIFLSAFAITAGGCASDDSASQQQVNTLPWNRPEKWEQSGPLGPMLNY
jgi:hypothetical protein